jgi:hypothetical protein
LIELCPACGRPAEKATWMTNPKGQGVLFVHEYEKHGRVLLAVGCFVPFDSDEYRAWQARS